MGTTDTELSISDSKRFFWFFAIGASVMALLKLSLNVQQVWVTIPPLTLMLIYAIQLAQGHHASNRPERAGDNIYYLGFLYTLLSLGLALYEFGVNTGEKGGLISDFAIALTTTMAGVLGRVLLTQGDKEIDEYEKEAKLHIAEAIDELRGDLERSRETMTDFASVTRQVLEENRDEQRKQLEQDREAFEAHFKESLSKMSEVMTQAVNSGSEKLKTELERLASNISEQVGVFTDNVKTLNIASKDLSTTLTTTLDALKSLPDPHALLDEKVQALVAPLEQAATQMTKVLDQQKVWAERSVSGVETIVTKLGDLGQAFDTISRSGNASLKILEAPVVQVAEKMQAVESSLSVVAKHIAAMHTATQSLDQLPGQLSRSVECLQSGCTAIGESGEQLVATLSDFHRALERERKTQLDAATEDAKSLQLLASERNTLNQKLTATHRQIDTQVTLLGTQLEQMSEALIAAARYIRQEAGSVS